MKNQIIPAYTGKKAVVVQNLKIGNPPNQFINDVDWVYFDEQDLSTESEKRTEQIVRRHFADIPLKFDVKNQARVHIWYKDKFGYEIEPYDSIESAIKTWPTTATSVAITSSASGRKLFAPFGLEDLMSLTTRPNKAQITESIYLAKVERWKKCWPSLKVINWN